MRAVALTEARRPVVVQQDASARGRVQAQRSLAVVVQQEIGREVAKVQIARRVVAVGDWWKSTG